jgi:hypothetical protein
MKIDSPKPSPRRWLPPGAPRDGMEARPGRERVLRSALLLALLFGCGGSSGDGGAVEPAGCAADDECAEGQQCIDAGCVEPAPPPGTSAGRFACSVVNCPPSQPFCCVAVEATATGNGSQGYASRNDMVVMASSSPGEVRANFTFDAADQQGWLTFDLGSELDLDRLQITAVHFGSADRFLSVSTNRSDDSGCSFGFELEPRPGGFGNDIFFNNNSGEFCYGDGVPGRARQVAFAIFSTRPADAMLVISNITLRE